MPFEGGTSRILMEECLRWYMMEYHVDGFILNPDVTPTDGSYADPLLSKMKLFHHQAGFQNVMRRFLKGDEGMIEEVIYWLRRPAGAEGMYNYIAGHNGFTLNDLVSYDAKHNEAMEKTTRMDRITITVGTAEQKDPAARGRSWR